MRSSHQSALNISRGCAAGPPVTAGNPGVTIGSSTHDDVSAALDAALDAARKRRGGQVATYIPQLGAADPERLGIAWCSIDGTVTAAGDAEMPFTIQSISKPFLYAAALTAFGRDRVHERVGVEPTGQAFNAFTSVESGTKRPRNPMVNAGVIAVIDLLVRAASDDATRRGAVYGVFDRFAGDGPPGMDEAVYESERAHGVRNRVIAYLMKYFRMIETDVPALLDAYYAACSALVTSRSLAVMGACLANRGIHPLTGARALPAHYVGSVLTVMMTCGMYDASGRWVNTVGLPAKSGVSGGLLAVVPGQGAVAAYSPPLDRDANSVRGWVAIHTLARHWNAHGFTVRRPAATPALDGDTLARIVINAARAGDGAAASYLPAPKHLDARGLAVCTTHGEEFEIGDARVSFSLQAAGNPMAYAIAHAAVGTRRLGKIVGVEPSGNPFHAIVIDERNGRPFNPLGNAGALAIAGAQPGSDRDDRFDRLASAMRRLAGRDDDLPVDPTVLEAERSAGDRNRAIAYYLVERGVLDDADAALDLYFRQCASIVTCRDLARMAACLAGGGHHPQRGDRVLPTRTVRDVVSVMYTCGMHEQSGRFAYEVGIPAKSGISGAIVAVVPGRMGIAVYAPPVDSAGTSVRGRHMLAEMARTFGLSLFAPHSARTDADLPPAGFVG